MPVEQHPNVAVAIIGTGFAGLCMAIRLKQAGITDFVLFEKDTEVGGTWRDNHYPGCACDIPSNLYSFSFAPNRDWSRSYPLQAEIFDYLKRVTDRHGLRRHIRFGTMVVTARFDGTTNLWQITTASGDSLTARVLVSAMGPLSRPSYPALKGLETFQGTSFHSAHWNHDFDLAGKRVAVIGTGASAIQFVPQIQPKAARLTLFQRTAPWVLPKSDRPFKPWEKRLFRLVPASQWLFRKAIYWQHEVRALGFTWKPAWMGKIETIAMRHLRRRIADPVLRAKLTPHYRIGCKRVLLSNDYYAALTQPNVDLVTTAIAEVRAHAIVTEDGTEYPVDAIIHGTGFRATDMLTPMHIYGLDGTDLNDAWADGAEAYLGIAISNYPNFFTIIGPNTGLGHNSMVFMIEASVHYVMKCLGLLHRRGGAAMAPRPEVQRRYNVRLQQKMAHTVWTTGCKSWYLDARGRNTTLWPDFTFNYWFTTRRVKQRDFEFAAAGASRTRAGIS